MSGLTRQSLRLFLFAALLSLAASPLFAQDMICAKPKERLAPGAKINYDFSKMNYNMASGVVFDMMVSPGDYEGKTAKITGQFTSEIHEGKRIFAVIMWDATGCCPTGLSVVPLEGKKYPADFPAEKSTLQWFLKKKKNTRTIFQRKGAK